MSEHAEVIAALEAIRVELRLLREQIAQNPAVQDSTLLSVTEVAKRLGVRYYTAREWVESGRLPSTIKDGRRRVPASALAEHAA